MNNQQNREKHYKKISIRRRIRIILHKLFYTIFLVLFIGIAGFITYDKELAESKFNDYVNLLSKKFNFSLKRIEVIEPLKYCTSIKPSLQNIEPDTSIFLVSIEDIRNELELLDCIEKVTIQRQFPDIIKIKVQEKQPITIWQDEQKYYYVTENGNIMSIRKLENIEKFIVITGKNAPINAPDLINFLGIKPELMSQITSAIWVGNRRWNIQLNDNTLIMLPEKTPEIAWNKYIRLYSQPEFKEKNYKIIDLRIPNRLYAK